MSIGRRFAALSCAGAVVFASAAAAADAVTVGLSDQHETSFSDLRFRTLPIAHVRLVVPWDAAIVDPAPVDAWLRAAEARGLTPLVSFERSRGAQCPGQPCTAPSPAAFGDAFAAFRARWPAVREFAAWNEPNHAGQPFELAPRAAAQLHDVLRRACPACVIVAGDVVDNASMKGWLNDYRAALTTPVLVWGLHDYGDVTYDRASYLDWLLAKVPEPVWLTETGGIVRLTKSTQDLLAPDEQRAAESVRKAFAAADAHPDRVERLYLYQWQAAVGEDFDAGLLRPDGSARPSLDVVRARLGTVPPRPEPVDVTATPEPDRDPPVASESGPPAVAYQGMPVAGGGVVADVAGPRPVAASALRRTKRGYSVLVRCPVSRTRGCRGRVTLAARRARAQGGGITLGSAALKLAPGAQSRAQVRVPAARLRKARALRRWQLVAVVVLRNPSSLAETRWNRSS
jgi:hypothetical protein